MEKTVTLDFDRLTQICERANKPLQDAALDLYLKDKLHQECRVAESFTSEILDEVDRIKAGRPSVRFAFTCCRDCFKDILCQPIELAYTVSFPSFDTDETRTVPASVLKRIERESDPRKFAALTSRHGLTLKSTEHMPVWEDIKRRNAYVEAVRDLLTTGARLAKSIGTERCAFELLKASHFTYPRTTRNAIEGKLDEITPLLTEDAADRFFDAVESALVELWAAAEYAGLKPLPPCRGKVRR